MRILAGDFLPRKNYFCQKLNRMTTTIAPEVAERLYTVEEWLELEKHADTRHEYYFGKLIPMAGEAKRANMIAKNILKKLDDPLIEKGYELYDHDIKAEVVPGGIYRYPDLVVAPVVDDEHDYIVKMPVLMVEVASDLSANRDRIKKRREYLEIPTLWYYLIVAQDEMFAELHTRNAEGRWETRYFTEPEESIEFPRFELAMTLADAYQRVKMPA